MVEARRDFLSKGYYAKLSSKLNQFTLKEVASSISKLLSAPSLDMDSRNRPSSLSFLDIGCGEGYYTSELMKFMQDQNVASTFIGLDISREAIKLASSTNKEILWVVGNSHYLPVKDSSVDCAFSVFSPVKIPEVIRILKDDGVFIRVLPGVNHLIQIRNIIYPNVIMAEENDLSREYEGLILRDEIKVAYDISLDAESLLSLVRMTPHYWKTSKADKEALEEIKSLTVSIDMNIRAYVKDNYI
jgi:23S rRNA (guanine745-N1)-methyltransferase